MVDTKNFTFKTGVRTFEAAAYLRKCGVDIIKVKKWFQSDLNSYNEIANIVKMQKCMIILLRLLCMIKKIKMQI